MARHHNYAPILNKNFIIDEYQIIEARSNGADAILLIAACLSQQEIKQLSAFAKSLDLEVLLEIHQADELSKVCKDVDMVGVNNRNLKSFDTDLSHSLELVERIPNEFIKVGKVVSKQQMILCSFEM